jgi:hypothetical protein
MANIDEMIKEEWRNLGFYYDLDESVNIKWNFYGSRDFYPVSMDENYNQINKT